MGWLSSILIRIVITLIILSIVILIITFIIMKIILNLYCVGRVDRRLSRSVCPTLSTWTLREIMVRLFVCFWDCLFFSEIVRLFLWLLVCLFPRLLVCLSHSLGLCSDHDNCEIIYFSQFNPDCQHIWKPTEPFSGYQNGMDDDLNWWLDQLDDGWWLGLVVGSIGWWIMTWIGGWINWMMDDDLDC